MSKKLIISVLVGVAVIGGAAYFLTNKEDSDQSSSQPSSQQATTENATEAAVFNPAATSELDYVATINTSDGDKTYVGKMEFDKDSGNTSYSATIDGQESLTVYTKDAYYFCQTIENCIKYPLNQIGASSFDPEAYAYTEAEIADYKNSSTFEGKEDCSVGTCDVWKVSQSGYDTVIYVDSATQRIVQVEAKTATGSSDITYEYKEVTVTPPANAEEIPGL